MTAPWIPASEALSLFSQQYSNLEHGKQIFCLCLEMGLVRARGTLLKGRRDGIGNIPVPLLDNDEINQDLWSDAELDDERAWRKGEFRFKDDWNHFICIIEDVEFNKSDIIKIHSRKGVGGRPVKKAAWEAVTHELVAIAMSGSASDYDSAASLRDTIVLRIGEGALSDSSLQGIINRVYKRHFCKTELPDRPRH